jgi:hypothetical protein
MPYKLNKTNGTLVTTVQDATVDSTTSLTFLGRNYTGYGDAIEENFLHLLENFASGNATDERYVPSNTLLSPIQERAIAGQLWFNTSTNQLNVTPNGLVWKGIASLAVTTSTLNTSTTISLGDMFWDGAYLQVWNGVDKTTIGPYLDTGLGSVTFEGIDSTVVDLLSPTGQQRIPVGLFKLFNGVSQVPIAAYSNSPNFEPLPTSPINSGDPESFPLVQRGITLRGTNSEGSSFRNNDYNSSFLLWGTASESLTTRNIALQPSSTSTVGYVPFSGITSIGTALTTSTAFTYNPGTGVVSATATSAFYADLAERYEADAVYEVGTVLIIGGPKEVTTTDQFADTRVAGIVSTNPAYMMNSDAGTDETHPYIALKGRVPCKVLGYIEKGDLIVTSSTPGYGCAAKSVSSGSVIGKALGTQSEGFGIIEVLVV